MANPLSNTNFPYKREKSALNPMPPELRFLAQFCGTSIPVENRRLSLPPSLMHSIARRHPPSQQINHVIPIERVESNVVHHPIRVVPPSSNDRNSVVFLGEKVSSPIREVYSPVAHLRTSTGLNVPQKRFSYQPPIQRPFKFPQSTVLTSQSPSDRLNNAVDSYVNSLDQDALSSRVPKFDEALTVRVNDSTHSNKNRMSQSALSPISVTSSITSPSTIYDHLTSKQIPSQIFRGPLSPTSTTSTTSDVTVDGTVNGVLICHIVAGLGLIAEETSAQELFCVIEIDSVKRATTIIQTGNDFLVWDETFELDLHENNLLTVQIYQLQSNNRSKLCFWGNVKLSSWVGENTSAKDYPSFDQKCLTFSGTSSLNSSSSSKSPLSLNLFHQSKTANPKLKPIKLQPCGHLYLETHFIPLRIYFSRPIVMGSLFGSPLETNVKQQNISHQTIHSSSSSSSTSTSSPSISRDSIQSSPPTLINKCIEEVQRRGMDVTGIYSIQTSVQSKAPVISALERCLSEDSLDVIQVPNIHIITNILKDYLHQLPEPLFTDSLYVASVTQMSEKDGDRVMDQSGKIAELLHYLPAVYKETLGILMNHFTIVLQHSIRNELTLQELSRRMGPSFFYPSARCSSQLDEEILQPRQQVNAFRCLLENWPSVCERQFQLTQVPTSSTKFGLFTSHWPCKQQNVVMTTKSPSQVSVTMDKPKGVVSFQSDEEDYENDSRKPIVDRKLSDNSGDDYFTVKRDKSLSISNYSSLKAPHHFRHNSLEARRRVNFSQNNTVYFSDGASNASSQESVTRKPAIRNISLTK